MPIDLPIVAGQLNAWLDRRSDELLGLRSSMQRYDMDQILHFVEALQHEQSRWDVQGDALFIPGIRDRVVAIANAQRLNIEADSMRWEKAQFDSKSKATLEIIAAKLADQPTERDRSYLDETRNQIEAWRAEAAKDYQLDDERVTNEQRLIFYSRINISWVFLTHGMRD
jgi:site-specific DNA-cytosine methylase